MAYAELEAQGVTSSSDYKDKDGYEKYLINIALNPKNEKCESGFDYADNDTTREYCQIKKQLYDVNDSFNFSRSIASASIVLFIGLVLGGTITLASKQRNVAAYNMQQTMPVAQEGLEKMAPVYGKIAKEIGKGIKEGMKDEDKE